MRLGNYSFFDIGNNTDYFDDHKNRAIINKVKEKCYLKTNALLLDLINKHEGKFRVSFSLSGSVLDQFEEYAPDVMESFKQLANTGCVEFLNETYNHSLSFVFSKDEFKAQVLQHKKKIQELFNQTPTVFRNTELIFNNELAKFVQDMGYDAVIAEGADHILQGRSPNFLYTAVTADKIKVLLKNYRLSDDVAFRFSDKNWVEHPLYVEKYVDWINQVNGNGELVNLFMDYETFGEHQWEDTGIFNFMESFPGQVLSNPDNNFVTVSEAAKKYDSRGVIDVHNFVSWADLERDLTAWLGNPLQGSASNALYQLERYVKATNNIQLLEIWRKLTTSDHFYYMCTKWFSDGDVHKYFNPYDSPYDAYIIFMNVLNDFARRVKTELKESGTLPQELNEEITGKARVLEGFHENPSVIINRI
jgi:alpha-amylase